ncbi:MAG: hypothetical protein QOJ64_677 [Acidobacteriota bacterium]|nr:hypothetical protein [Acidobacteriota bacterium]
MMRVLLTVVLIISSAIVVFAQDSDVLDLALRSPRGETVQNPDGSYRSPKYGDHLLEQAVEQLSQYPRPWTVPRLITWYRRTSTGKTRAYLLRALAVSRDARAAIVLGESLKDDSLDVRVAASYGLLDYFMPVAIFGGTEQHMLAVQEWWEQNRERLKTEEVRSEFGISDPISLDSAIPSADPAKYESVRDGSDWRNPYLVIRPDGVELFAGSPVSQRRIVSTDELARTLAKLPLSAWPYGRVVAMQTVGLRNGFFGSEVWQKDEQIITRNRSETERIMKSLEVAIRLWPSN